MTGDNFFRRFGGKPPGGFFHIFGCQCAGSFVVASFVPARFFPLPLFRPAPSFPPVEPTFQKGGAPAFPNFFAPKFPLAHGALFWQVSGGSPREKRGSARRLEESVGDGDLSQLDKYHSLLGHRDTGLGVPPRCRHSAVVSQVRGGYSLWGTFVTFRRFFLMSLPPPPPPPPGARDVTLRPQGNTKRVIPFISWGQRRVGFSVVW